MRSRHRLAVAFVCAQWIFSLSAIAVVGEDTLPEARWISASIVPADRGAACFRKTFTAPPQLAKASILAACDERMTLWINGVQAAEIGGFNETASRDVSTHIRPGLNTVAIRVENTRAFPAFRLLLEMATDQGRQTWVVSDHSWVCSGEAFAGWEKPEFDTRKWRAPIVHGANAAARWPSKIDLKQSPDLYNSWMLASKAPRATEAAAIRVPPGFRVELLRSASADEGSWIALAFDPQGRLTIAREKRGLLRLTFHGNAQSVELLDDTLLECRGLLYAHGALYVNANNSKGFYRLRDTDGDDQFDEKQLLLQTTGGVGHGRNHAVLGPDGMIYLVHGNDVELPENLVAPSSPFAHFAPDQLFPMRWGEHGTTDFVRPPHGHILQTDRDGKTWRLIAGGLRNALDVAFNSEGEMFAYDADNERDIAAPWYRPTRILHVVPGAEFGWRAGAGKWPTYLPDTLPAAVDIGIGSPCGIEFGSHSNFPGRLRKALFVADWAYGRILAVHLQPEGASYRGVTEPFISGRPLNVTDLTFGPEGAMYFTTGGRGTQSGLYRVSVIGAGETKPNDPPSSPPPERLVRKQLEKLQVARVANDSLDEIWRHLGDSDRWVRFAARVALEAQPVEAWKERAFAENDVDKFLSAMLALARVSGADFQRPILSRVASLALSSMSASQKLAAIRVYEVSCARAGRPGPEQTPKIVDQLIGIYPARDRALDHELCRLLAYLESTEAVAPTVELLSASRTSEDLLHYLWHLRHLHDGWTVAGLRAAFEALQRAEQHQGARDYLQALRDVRRDLTAFLSAETRAVLGNALAAGGARTPPPPVETSAYQFVKAWTIDDFSQADLAEARSLERGREAYAAAQCVQCHRIGEEAGGSIGPNLAGIGSRLSRRDLLRHILEPSQAIDDKFRNHNVTLKDGGVYVGAIESEDAREVRLAIGSGADAVITLPRADILRREASAVSPMPEGLLNNLTRTQILDLLTYLQAAAPPP